MPELPEVETVKKRLKPLVVGKKINQLKILREKSFQGSSLSILNTTIVNVLRRAKILQIKLDNNLSLLIHLKMTGQLIYVDQGVRVGGGHPTADWVRELPSSHTRVIITLADSVAKDKKPSLPSTLFFNDMRIFGWIKVFSETEVEKEFSKYGPDVNSIEFDFFYLKEKLKNKTQAIKLSLMDNSIVAGIGNIYASEILFLAQVKPNRSSKSLTDIELNRVIEFSKIIIEKAIVLGGTTFDGRYVDTSGFAGGFQKELLVYGKDGQSCKICGSRIEKIKLGGRSSFYCPFCQR